MEIKTKYEKGQSVWIMNGSGVGAKPTEVVISGIHVVQNQIWPQPNTSYKIYPKSIPYPKDTDSLGEFNEIWLFPTKKELLKSL